MADPDHNQKPGPVDYLLDGMVWLGYIRIGYARRHRHWHDDPRSAELTGKHVLIARATSGS
jgi:hypothetical protein